MVKMETRHPIGGPFGREFSAFVIIAELWRPEVARPGNVLSNFCFFWKKNPLLWNFQNSVCVTTPIDIVVLKCRKFFSDGKLLKSCVIYQTKITKFRLPLNLLLLHVSQPKSARASPNIWLTMFQISSKSVHFRRSYSRMREGRSFGP